MLTEEASSIQLINFIVNEVRMCAYLKNVKKVLPLVALENVPGGPPYLAGLMNMKGKIIPVIDLAIRSGMARQKKLTIEMPVLLCETETNEVAMIVDSIIGLSDFDKKSLQMNKEFDQSHSPFLGAITQDTDSSLLINIDYLLQTDLINNQDGYGSQTKN